MDLACHFRAGLLEVSLYLRLAAALGARTSGAAAGDGVTAAAATAAAAAADGAAAPSQLHGMAGNLYPVFVTKLLVRCIAWAIITLASDLAIIGYVTSEQPLTGRRGSVGNVAEISSRTNCALLWEGEAGRSGFDRVSIGLSRVICYGGGVGGGTMVIGCRG